MSEGQKRAATKRKRSKKQGVGGKPTVVKAMKNKVAVRKCKSLQGKWNNVIHVVMYFQITVC